MKDRPRGVVVAVPVATLCLIVSCAMTRTGAWTQAQEYYDSGDYRTAIQKADMVLSYGTPSAQERASATYLKAQCYEKLGQLSDAIALYAFVKTTFPETPQAYQATMALARLVPPDTKSERGSF